VDWDCFDDELVVGAAAAGIGFQIDFFANWHE
jgi:hypothetical protein